MQWQYYYYMLASIPTEVNTSNTWHYPSPSQKNIRDYFHFYFFLLPTSRWQHNTSFNKQAKLPLCRNRWPLKQIPEFFQRNSLSSWFKSTSCKSQLPYSECTFLELHHHQQKTFTKPSTGYICYLILNATLFYRWENRLWKVRPLLQYVLEKGSESTSIWHKSPCS